MLAILIGSIGFILFFIYDYNSIRLNNRLFQSFFGAGCFFIIISTIIMLYTCRPQNDCFAPVSLLFASLSIIFFIALIYTLFFALPFDETYIKESYTRRAYTEGVYALCRHPGVLWFAGFYIFMAAALRSFMALIVSIVLIIWNILYIIYQDRFIFPITFINYHEYKQNTPFLLPTKSSIHFCLNHYINKERRKR